MNFVCLSKETNQRKDTTSKNSKICYAPRSRANLALEILSSHRTWTAQRTVGKAMLALGIGAAAPNAMRAKADSPTARYEAERPDDKCWDASTRPRLGWGNAVFMFFENDGVVKVLPLCYV